MAATKSSAGRASKKTESKQIEGIQKPKMGKPVHHTEHTSHHVEVDAKGKRHHRIHHTVETTYEYPEKDDSALNHALAGRGY